MGAFCRHERIDLNQTGILRPVGIGAGEKGIPLLNGMDDAVQGEHVARLLVGGRGVRLRNDERFSEFPQHGPHCQTPSMGISGDAGVGGDRNSAGFVDRVLKAVVNVDTITQDAFPERSGNLSIIGLGGDDRNPTSGGTKTAAQILDRVHFRLQEKGLIIPLRRTAGAGRRNPDPPFQRFVFRKVIYASGNHFKIPDLHGSGLCSEIKSELDCLFFPVKIGEAGTVFDIFPFRGHRKSVLRKSDDLTGRFCQFHIGSNGLGFPAADLKTDGVFLAGTKFVLRRKVHGQIPWIGSGSAVELPAPVLPVLQRSFCIAGTEEFPAFFSGKNAEVPTLFPGVFQAFIGLVFFTQVFRPLFLKFVPVDFRHPGEFFAGLVEDGILIVEFHTGNGRIVRMAHPPDGVDSIQKGQRIFFPEFLEFWIPVSHMFPVWRPFGPRTGVFPGAMRIHSNSHGFLPLHRLRSERPDAADFSRKTSWLRDFPRSSSQDDTGDHHRAYGDVRSSFPAAGAALPAVCCHLPPENRISRRCWSRKSGPGFPGHRQNVRPCPG